MTEDLQFEIPVNNTSIIKVLGVGGGGSNAVNHMFRQGIKDVDFVICNTDSQALLSSPVPLKIQLGESLTEGRGAGNKPNVGKQSAIESLNDIAEVLSSGTKMVFITAGMGGGTGTGAAPVIAKAAKEMGILTVAIVTIPFRFEGQQRINQAVEGIREMQENVDALLIINNEKLREIYGDLKLSEAFIRADNVLATAAKGIAEIITVHGYINVDFADVQTVMSNSGIAIMGSGSAGGEDRAIRAIQDALTSPLLNNNDIKGAGNILLNITSGVEEISMDEVGEITDYLNIEIASDANIIWGTGTDESLGDKVNITVIATGFEANNIPELYNKAAKKQIKLKEETKEKETTKSEELIFEVHDKKGDIKPLKEQPTGKFGPLGSDTQQSFKFALDEDAYPAMEEMSPVDKKHIEKQIKGTAEQKNKQGQATYNLNSLEDIDKLENTPAYKRKQIKLENKSFSAESNFSRFTLSEDEEGNVVLKENNPYLNDNID